MRGLVWTELATDCSKHARLILAGMSLLTTVSDASEDVRRKVGVWIKADSVTLFDDFTYVAR